MNGRFLTLPMIFTEEEDLMMANIRILPLSIECYLESVLQSENEDGEIEEKPSVRVYTKSGLEFEILMHIDEFEEKLKAY